MGLKALSSERSRPILVDIAISAPARSIDAHATSISRVRMISRIGRSWTSTSNMDCSSASGLTPWDIVRLPCGSRSTHSTRWPSSAKAAARFSVVVVFATPPFWLAKAMTLAWGVTDELLGSGRTIAAWFPLVRAVSCTGGQNGGMERARDDATGLTHVATVSFLASRAAPSGQFWLALGGGMALARAAALRGAATGYGAAAAAMLQTVAVM